MSTLDEIFEAFMKEHPELYLVQDLANAYENSIRIGKTDISMKAIQFAVDYFKK